MSRLRRLSIALLLLGPVNAAVHADDTWAAADHRGGDIVSIGHDSSLPSGQQADSVVSIFGSSISAGDAVDVVSIFGNTRVTGPVQSSAVAVIGNAYIDAKVAGDAVAVVGSVQLGPHAEIGGNVVSVLGSVRRDPTAIVHGGVQSVFSGDFGNFDGLHAWLAHCLFYGRPLSLSVGLGWAWGLALGFLALYVCLALLAPAPIRRCVRTFETQPGQTLLAAIIAMLLWPVLIVLLGVTLVGIAAIPFVVTAIVCAVLFGKAVMLAWLGGRMTGGHAVGAVGHPAFAVVIGGAVVLGLYLVPVLGFLVYNLLGILGFGAVVYTLILTLRTRQAATPAPPGAAQPGASTMPLEGSAPRTAGTTAPLGGSAPPQTAGTIAPLGGSAPQTAGTIAPLGGSAPQTAGTTAPLGGLAAVAGTAPAPATAAPDTMTAAYTSAAAGTSAAADTTAAAGSASAGATTAAADAKAAAGPTPAGDSTTAAGPKAAGDTTAAAGPSSAGATTAAAGTAAAAARPPPVTASLPRAGFWIRMAALLIDVLLVGFAMSVLGHSSHLHLFVLGAYGAVMWRQRGATVGGIVFDLKVVRLDGREIDWETAIVRALACFLSLAVAGLGFIWIAFDAGNQAWHDKIAGTVVVRMPKNAPLV
jgi:uncharacterized RDD family membrane protein YckC